MATSISSITVRRSAVASSALEPLVLERAAERVDFGHHVAERLVAPGAAGADGEVALAQRRQQVGHGLQRPDDARLHGEGEAEPATHDQQGEGPLDLRPRSHRTTGSTIATMTAGSPPSRACREDALLVGESFFGLGHGAKGRGEAAPV